MKYSIPVLYEALIIFGGYLRWFAAHILEGHKRLLAAGEGRPDASALTEEAVVEPKRDCVF